MGSRFLALSVALAALAPALAQPAGAQGQDPAPATADWLAGDVRGSWDGLTRASIAGGFDVHKVTLQGAPRSAEDLRKAYAQLQAFGQAEPFVAGLEGALRDRLQAAVGSLFPSGNLTVESARVDRASLAAQQGPDPWHPPVRFDFRAALLYKPEDIGLAGGALSLDEAQLQAIFQLGVQASIPYDLTAQPGWNVTYAFTMPEGLRLTSAQGASLSPDGRTATWELRNWRGLAQQRLPTEVVLRGRDAPAEPRTDARVEVAVDMSDVTGLSIPGLLQGDFGTLALRFDAKVVARSLKLADFPDLDEQLRARLPARLQVEGLNADGLRVAAREGLLPPDAMARLEQAFRGLAEERLAGFGASGVAIEGGFGPATLGAEHISNPPDGDPPLVYAVGARFTIPLGEREEARLQAAGGAPLLSRSLDFPVPLVRGLPTTYRITFPPGISLGDLDLQGGSAERGTLDGRDYVVVTPGEEGAHATFTVAVTSDFVLSKFWYIWLGVVLSAALAVAFLLLRRARRRAKPALAEEEPPEPAPHAPEAPAPAPAAPAQPPAGPGPRPGGAARP